jgi:hypothetical protein
MESLESLTLQDLIKETLQRANTTKDDLAQLKKEYEEAVETRIGNFCTRSQIKIKNKLIDLLLDTGFTPEDTNYINESIVRAFTHDGDFYDLDLRSLYSGNFLNKAGEALYVKLYINPSEIEITLCHDTKRLIPVPSGKVVIPPSEQAILDYIKNWLNDPGREQREFQIMLSIMKSAVELLAMVKNGTYNTTRDWSYESMIARKAILLGYATEKYEWIGPPVFVSNE